MKKPIPPDSETPPAKGWQRARSPDQRQERIDAILGAAGRLLDEGGLDATGLNAIAREAGMSKPNLYRYFESREAILLELLEEQVRGWARALAKKLRPLAAREDASKPAAASAVAQAFAGASVRRSRLWILMTSLATVLERNVGHETVREFKRTFLREIQPGIEALQAALPPMTWEDAYGAIGAIAMAACGTHPHAHPAPVVREVLAEPEFAGLCVDFRKSVEDHARVYLTGLLALREGG